jgi:hypothetical protein
MPSVPPLWPLDVHTSRFNVLVNVGCIRDDQKTLATFTLQFNSTCEQLGYKMAAVASCFITLHVNRIYTLHPGLLMKMRTIINIKTSTRLSTGKLIFLRPWESR